MAWSQKFESEAGLGAFGENRGARQASAHVPIFFTSQSSGAPAPLHHAQPVRFETAHPSYARSARETYYENPLYRAVESKT